MACDCTTEEGLLEICDCLEKLGQNQTGSPNQGYFDGDVLKRIAESIRNEVEAAGQRKIRGTLHDTIDSGALPTHQNNDEEGGGAI